MRFWILSGVVVLLGMALWLALAPDSALLATATRGYPYVLLVAVVALAWRFQRSRLACAALLAGAVHLALALWPASEHRLLFAAMTLITPLTLGLLAMADDRGLFSRGGIVQLVLAVAVPIGLIALAPVATPEIQRILEPVRVPALPDGSIPLPQSAFLAFLAGAAVAGGALIRRRRPTEVGLLLTLVAILLMLQAPPGDVAQGAWLLAIGGVLALGVVESSYAMAYYDELTGLPARRALRQALDELKAPYAIAVADIDHFKKVNDRYGHDVGDQVLRMVATRLSRVRGGRVYRSGGEEFTVVFAGLSGDEAHEQMDALRLAVKDAPFRLRDRHRPARKPAAPSRRRLSGGRRELNVTLSAGVAAGDSRKSDPDQVLKAADQALYKAKRAGRNRVA